MKRENWLVVGWAVVFVVWVVIVISAYFVVHKTWQINQLIGMLRSLLSLLLGFLVGCLAGGIGNKLLAWANFPAMAEIGLIEFSLGAGFLGLVLFLLGIAGLLFKLFFWVLFLVGLFVFRDNVIAWLGRFRGLLAQKRLSSIEKILFGFVLSILLLNLLRSLAPPTKWDALVYHLELPKQYLKLTRISPSVNNLYAGFPQLASMVYMFAMGLFRDSSALVLCWMVGVVAMLGLEGFSRRLFGKGTCWLAPSILLSGISLSQSFSWGYVDVWLLMYGAAALICLHHFTENFESHWVILAGMMCGFAMSVKYTAGLFVVVFGLFVLIIFIFDLLSEGRLIKSFKEFTRLTFITELRFGLVVLAIFSPWMLKNYVFTGNPLYPMSYFSSDSDTWAQVFQSGSNPERALLSDILLPWDASIYGIENAVVEGKPEYAASVGPLMLALIPGLFLAKRELPSPQWENVKKWMFLSISVWIVWAFAAHLADQLIRARHYYGFFPVFSLLGVAGFRSISSIKFSEIRFSKLISALVVLTLLFSAVNEFYTFIRQNPLPVVIGIETADEYVKRITGGYGELMESLNAFPEEVNFFMLWEPRVYYCERDCFLDGNLHNWWYLHKEYGEGDKIASALIGEGYTYLVIYNLGLEWARESEFGLNAENARALNDFWINHLELVAEVKEEYSIFKVLE